LDQVQLLGGSILPLVENVAGLHASGAAGQHATCVVYLKGTLLSVSAAGRAFVFHDETGIALLETKTPHRSLRPGDDIVLAGNCLVEGDRVLLSDPPVVDNNNTHGMTEKSGAIYLKAGKHPIRLAWFNRELPYGLEVYYQGPDLPRQKIPDAALFRQSTEPSAGWENGLDYCCYEGEWLRVPHFDGLAPTRQGVAANFDLSLIPRVENIGMQFTGAVEAPRDGIYNFSTISDDGSLLFVDEGPPVIDVKGTNVPPEPALITVRQNLRADQDYQWAQVEGTVTFASERAGELELELGSDLGQMRILVADGSSDSPKMLLNSRVRATGISLATRASDGQLVAGTLLVPGTGQIELRSVPAERWGEHSVVSINSLGSIKVPPGADTIVHLRGKIQSAADGDRFIADETGSIPLPAVSPATQSDNSLVEALGSLVRTGTNLVLQCAFCREITSNSPEGTATLPILTTVEQIKHLTREEWQRGYPVEIHGVITSVLDSGFFIQDSTRSIYARWYPPTDKDGPRVGDFWEVEGKTFAEFAPNIMVSGARRVCTGALPEPLRPTWDQLINGSLDTEYIEVQGIITRVGTNEVALLTRNGKVRLLFPELQTRDLQRYENGLVRVRGCVTPVRENSLDRQFVPGQMALCNASITLDEAAPADSFAIKLKHSSDLLAFDVGAGALQRVKIAGQIVHQRDGEYFLMDGNDGLRFIPKSPVELRVGDLAEVVGFPELGGPSPVLREATVRKVGEATLPEPVMLPADAPLNRKLDATLVRVRARLAAVSEDQSEQVLELQTGTRGLVARLKTGSGRLPAILPGSLLEVTGVYAGQGNDLPAGREINSFELLLNSASGVTVLARPSWWTTRHTLSVLGVMATVTLAALCWIALLRRQVEERSSQLAAEIRRHEHTERQRELEEERARIARDLHDDLGASLTQIRFLSAVESRDSQLPESTRSRMGQVSEKSRELVASLDEIVWAVNPANDSLPNVANYLCHFAEELFRPTSVRCRLDVEDSLPPVPLTSEVRHNLYLAVREALNNVLKHSQATESWLRIHFQPPGTLSIVIEDNGRGFSASPNTSQGDGLVNMRQRLETLGGRFEQDAPLDAGVVCRFILPLEKDPLTKPEA
jgi:signal transduction histidine kinase